MVHSVEYRVGSGRKVGTTLPYPSKDVEEALPKLVHFEHLVSCVSVKEETLAEEREIPVKEKENNDNHNKLLINTEQI
jgi:hypothetical protein